MVRNLSEKLRRELKSLGLVSDDEIDVSDIAETSDWSTALRGLWSGRRVENLDYDIRAVANEILKRAWKRGYKPTNMWLNKAAWFVYEKLLTEYGKLLTSARVEAWDHGPVFREIYGPAKVHRDEPIASLLTAFSISSRAMEVAEGAFDEVVSETIDAVVKEFGGKPASQLRSISHIEGSPWYRVWYSGNKTSAGMVISPQVILAAGKARSDGG